VLIDHYQAGSRVAGEAGVGGAPDGAAVRALEQPGELPTGVDGGGMHRIDGQPCDLAAKRPVLVQAAASMGRQPSPRCM